MECREVEKLLQPFFDGELDDETAALVGEAIAHCPDCLEKLEWLEAMREGLRAPIAAEAASVSLDGLWDAIEGQLDAPEAVRVAPEATVPIRTPHNERDRSWSFAAASARLRDLFAWENLFGGQGLALAGVAAALALAVIWLLRQDPTEFGVNRDTVASAERARAAAATAAAAAAATEEENHLAFVSSIEVDSGFVFIDQVAGDPSKPLIVWHVDDAAPVDDDDDDDNPPGSQGG